VNIEDASIWIHPWDLEGWAPEAFVERLRGFGLTSCSLALTYHATRMVLPTHRSRRVIATDVSTAYVDLPALTAATHANKAANIVTTDAVSDSLANVANVANVADVADVVDGSTGAPSNLADARAGAFMPAAGDQRSLVAPFLDACQRVGFGVRGWMVLCHQDGAGRAAPDLCMTNVYGERLDYALCPSQPAVRDWCAASCASAAALAGIESLDIEAASFMGFDHQSAHDKRGVPLPAALQWLLSLCVCTACRARMDAHAPGLADAAASRARAAIDAYLARWDGAANAAAVSVEEALTVWLGADILDRLLTVRQDVLRALVASIRARTGTTPLWIRLAGSPFFTGGKTALPLDALTGLADGAVMTWLGASIETITRELQALPAVERRAVPIRGGFTLHAPDCSGERDVVARVSALRDARMHGVAAYCYGLATDAHLRWLRAALRP
jgi:hypothetical protein